MVTFLLMGAVDRFPFGTSKCSTPEDSPKVSICGAVCVGCAIVIWIKGSSVTFASHVPVPMEDITCTLFDRRGLTRPMDGNAARWLSTGAVSDLRPNERIQDISQVL